MSVPFVLALFLIAPVIFLYFLVIKGTDRYEPEPFWLLTVMFLWGAVIATLTAIAGNQLGMSALGWALDAKADDPVLAASTASFVAPLVEETTKGVGLLGLWWISSLWLKELDGALDGAIYGGVVGLGFTLTEDVLYVGSAAAQGGAEALTAVFLLRTVLSGLGHASFTAMTGLGIGIAVESRSLLVKLITPAGGWCAAVGLHSLHNFLVTFLFQGGIGLGLKFIVFWSFGLLFFTVIVLLALRDRAIVLRGLIDEVGRLLHPRELAFTTSYLMLVPFWNFFSLLGTRSGYPQARRKQLDLIKLAFVKQRRRRDASQELARWEYKLRERIHAANLRGVFVGPR